MNTNKSKRFTRFAAATIAAAGILGGSALGFAAGANASTASPQQQQATPDTNGVIKGEFH